MATISRRPNTHLICLQTNWSVDSHDLAHDPLFHVLVYCMSWQGSVWEPLYYPWESGSLVARTRNVMKRIRNTTGLPNLDLVLICCYPVFFVPLLQSFLCQDFRFLLGILSWRSLHRHFRTRLNHIWRIPFLTIVRYKPDWIQLFFFLSFISSWKWGKILRRAFWHLRFPHAKLQPVGPQS